MITIDTTIDIDAPTESVWKTLTDFDTYPEWNPHITAADGRLVEGERLSITFDREGDRPRELKVTVTAVEPERRLEWVGTMGHRSLFEGHHTFELEPIDGNRTRFHNREAISGILGSFLTTAEPECDYRGMNEALKTRAERRHEEALDA